MQWKCKFCLFSCEKRAQLLKHYRLNHGGFTRSTPIPCLYTDCLCSFKSFNSFRVHLTKNHSHQVHGSQASARENTPFIFHCLLCSFEEPCTEVKDSNPVSRMTKDGEPLSTISRRASYFQNEFPIVMPIEYNLDFTVSLFSQFCKCCRKF